LNSKTIQNVVVTVGLLAVLAGLGLYVTRGPAPQPPKPHAPRQVEIPVGPVPAVVLPGKADGG
jgi:hypothetical protein